MRLGALLAVLVCLLPSCGLGPDGGTRSVASPATLHLFSAPWCTWCTEELRSLDRQIWNDLSPAARARLSVNVWVISGSLISKPPTPAVVAEYKDKLAIQLPMQADPWKWTTYLKYYPEGGGILPGAVIEKPGSAPQAMELGTKPDLIFGNLKAALGDE